MNHINHINNIAELITELNDRRIEALKARDKPAETAYSYFLSIVKKVEKDGGGVDEIYNAFRKEKNALLENRGYARTDEELKTINYEISVIDKYLPRMMTEDEIHVIVLQVAKELYPFSAKDKGKFMKAIMAKVKGKADGKLVNKVVTDYFSSIV